MKRTMTFLLALTFTLAACLGLSGNALADAAPDVPDATAFDPGAAFEGIPYHGDPSACVMTVDQARTLAAKLGELIAEENDNSYKEGYVRRAALVDLGNGVPALYFLSGVYDEESQSTDGPGLTGHVDYFTDSGSAWEFKDGELVQFQPAWFYGTYMVYQNLSGNGRSGGSYVVPIENGVVDVMVDSDGFFWMDRSKSVAFYEWYLGSMGDNYEDAYEEMYAGENDEYMAVLKEPGKGSALGIFENEYTGLTDAADVWQALTDYAAGLAASQASDPTGLAAGYGEADIDALSPELLRAYAQKLRELPQVWHTDYMDYGLYNFSTLVYGDDGTVLLWVIPASMNSEWWGNEQYFTSCGASFVGRDHRLFGWDGAKVTEIGFPGADQIQYYPGEMEFMCVYHGTDADGQNWELTYPIENGGIAAQPRWSHASGFLYEYALEDAGITSGPPTDVDSCRAAAQAYFAWQVSRGEWPELPLDWSTLTMENPYSDMVTFDVYSGDYPAYRDAHTVTDQQYGYTYMDTSDAGGYPDIDENPDRWLLAESLADRLESVALFIEQSQQPPEEIPEEGGGTEPVPGDISVPDPDANQSGGGDTPVEPPVEPEKDSGISGGIIAAVGGGILGTAGAVTAVAIISGRKKKKAAREQSSQPATQPTPTQPVFTQPMPTQPMPVQPTSTQTTGGQGGFCPNCGAAHMEGDHYCTSCGAKL